MIGLGDLESVTWSLEGLQHLASRKIAAPYRVEKRGLPAGWLASGLVALPPNWSWRKMRWGWVASVGCFLSCFFPISPTRRNLLNTGMTTGPVIGATPCVGFAWTSIWIGGTAADSNRCPLTGRASGNRSSRVTRWYSGSPSCPITKRGSRMSCLPPMRDSRLSTSRSRWVRAHEVQRARRERTKPGDELRSVARREGSPASFRPVRTPSAIPRTPASAPRSELSPSDSIAPRQIWGQPPRLSATSGPEWRTNRLGIPRVGPS